MLVQSGTPNPDRVTRTRRYFAPDPLPPRVRPDWTDADRLATSLETDALWHKLEAERIRYETLAHLSHLVSCVAASIPPQLRSNVNIGDLPDPYITVARAQGRTTRGHRKSDPQDLAKLNRTRATARATARATRPTRERQAREAAASAFQSTIDSRPLVASSPRSPGAPRWSRLPNGTYYDAALMSREDALRISRLGR